MSLRSSVFERLARRRPAVRHDRRAVDPDPPAVDPVVTLPMAVLEVLEEAVLVVDGQRRIAGLSARAERLFSCTFAEVAGRPAEMLVPRHRQAPLEVSLIRFCRSTDRRLDIDLATARRIDGTEFPAAVSVVKWHRADGDDLLVMVVRDLREVREAGQALARTRAVLDGLMEHVGGATLVVDDAMRLVAANHAARTLFLDPTVPLGSLFADVRLAFGPAADALVSSALAARREAPRRLPPLGQSRWAFHLLPLGEGGATVVHFAELPPMASAVQGVAASVDEVTGLPDRRWLDQVIAHGLAPSPGSLVGLVMVEAEVLAEVGRALGPAARDELARSLTALLRRMLPAGVVLARADVHVFAVLAGAGATEDLDELAASLASGLRQWVRLGERALWLCPVVGTAVVDAADTAHLVRRAELALAEARSRGGYHLVAAAECPEAEAATAFTRRAAVWSAIQRGLVEVRFQPIVELTTQRVVGVEAVDRWDHPVLGEVSAEELRCAAGRAGATSILGAHTRSRALAQLAALRSRRPADDLGLGLDVGVAELRSPAFAPTFLHRLQAEGVDPARLYLEVSDDGTALGERAVQRTMRALAAEGVSWVIEGFGARPSSLEALLDLPVRVIKLAPRFVAPIDEDPRVEGMVRAVASMCAGLELLLVADGVERPAQAESLLDAGCGYGQGPLYAASLD